MKRLVAPTIVAAALFAMNAKGETETAEPDAYLDYIEATGSQYIDTGVNAETGLKARIDFMPAASLDPSKADWSFLDAAAPYTTSSDSRSRIFLCHINGAGKPFFGYGLKQRGNPSRAFPFKGGTRYEVVTDLTNVDSLQLYQDGMMTMTANDREKYTSLGNNVNLNQNLYVFATNHGGTPAWYGQGRVYEIKIFKKNAQSGELDLIRHYLPCAKGGRAGLYDKVNGTISYSFKSGSEFVAGPVLDKPLDFVEWIRGNGNQCFDTRVWGKGGLKSEIDISVNQTKDDHCILGARRDSGDTRFYPAYNYESQFRYAYGTMPGKDTINKVAPTVGVRYLIKSDIRDGFQSVTISANGGDPVELHKDTAYLTGEMFTTNTLYLLACNDGRYNQSKFYSDAVLYRTKIWDGDELLRDFVPVVATNSSGTAYAGLYDMVTKRVYETLDKAAHPFDLTKQVGAVTNTLRTIVRPATRLEYVESDGAKDFVNLGIIGKDGVEMEAVMEWLTVPSDGAFVGARTDTKKNISYNAAGVRCLLYHHWNGGHRLGYDGELWSISTNGVAVAATANTKYRITSHLEAGSQHYEIATRDGDAWKEQWSLQRSHTGPVDTGLPLWLFAINLDGKLKNPGHARVYSLKLSEKQQDGSYALVRNLVPVRDPLTGGVALWDKVTETYFRNSGKYMLAGGGEERPLTQGMMIIVK